MPAATSRGWPPGSWATGHLRASTLAPRASELRGRHLASHRRQSGTGIGMATWPAVRVLVTGGLDAWESPWAWRGWGAGLAARSPALGGRSPMARRKTQGSIAADPPLVFLESEPVNGTALPDARSH